ncbi:hypothetical protein M7I_3353 [Glarea lozoyensis 74030]|uniref:Uncharacterized protein n=1 Tax=Glarea lozoyensis (strain ATCC 74030 / MF5533) TaxID=1104152 RepID=H0EL93_GLAL7|nr:hypothetical protein M7I_3353 [Glarea lozoyensis 74030]
MHRRQIPSEPSVEFLDEPVPKDIQARLEKPSMLFETQM